MVKLAFLASLILVATGKRVKTQQRNMSGNETSSWLAQEQQDVVQESVNTTTFPLCCMCVENTGSRHPPAGTIVKPGKSFAYEDRKDPKDLTKYNKQCRSACPGICGEKE